jgi:single-strand DNA-binding protein
MSVNKAILLGNLGKDPELRKTAQGNSVCSFSIATTDRRKDAQGAWVESTEWHNIVTFGVTAENCVKYLKKGRQVFIDGRIVTRKWQDKEGKDRYTTEIIANAVQFVGNKGDSAPSSNYDDYAPPSESHQAAVFNGLKSADSIGSTSRHQEVAFDDDDIPF